MSEPDGAEPRSVSISGEYPLVASESRRRDDEVSQMVAMSDERRMTGGAALEAILEGLRSSGLNPVVVADFPGDGEIVVVAVTLGQRRGWALLSERERAVAELARKGLINRQIATRLGITTHTVNYHLRRIYQKLGIGSRVELAAFTGPE
ncbi:helix-turn-helix transcriptional regulator [Dactylosporangium vinaceum]|uniref:helix-turn-helix transcriptional regulator n=1 Tax=Dactylosporangium vinaceum TaxID=53362 RepID=UPI001CAA1B06|nr:helix-turn-helix transcriptional regulator [Dactylosporangium vinaceum]